MFISVVELLQKELQLLRKIRQSLERKLSQDERIRLFMKVKDFSLVELLEERWSYGCDLEIDLCRVLQAPINWSVDLCADHVRTSSIENDDTSISSRITTSVVSPQIASAFALVEQKSSITFEDEIKYLSRL
jgi:hypothetical protein